MRFKSQKYLKFVRSLDCSHCGNPETVPHHIIDIGMGIMGSKADDTATMPLCVICHDLVHKDAKSYPQTKWMLETQREALNSMALKV